MEHFEDSRFFKGIHIIKEIRNSKRGKLFKVEDIKREKKYALRVYKADSSFSSCGIDPHLLKQAQSISFQHPNIVRVEDIDLAFGCLNVQKLSCREGNLFILQELGDGNLNDWQNLEESITSSKDVTSMMFDILQGLHYLHSHKFTHRRLCPNNIIMMENSEQKFTAKLGDFYDLSVFFNNDHCEPLPIDKEHEVYTSPEILSGYDTYDDKSDMWSYGIVLFTMIFGRTPFDQGVESVTNQIWKMFGTPDRKWRETYTYNQNINYKAYKSRSFKEWLADSFAKKEIRRTFKGESNDKYFTQVVDLIDKCLILDPEQRISSLEAVNHPLFQKRRLQKGTIDTLPKCKLTKGRLFNLRQTLVNNALKDVNSGWMHFYPAVLGISIFDRSCKQFNSYIYADDEFNQELVRVLFCTCYMIAMKLMYPLPEKESDILETCLGGITCDLEDKLFTILYLEREIVKFLKFKFYTNQFANIPVDITIFKKLATKSFN